MNSPIKIRKSRNFFRKVKKDREEMMAQAAQIRELLIRRKNVRSVGVAVPSSTVIMSNTHQQTA